MVGVDGDRCFLNDKKALAVAGNAVREAGTLTAA
jgi:hypothetical protein